MRKYMGYLNCFDFKTLLILFLGVPASAQIQSNCPIPPTSVDAVVTAEVTFDKKTDLYTYKYTLSNSRSSLLKLDQFLLITENQPNNVVTPTRWKSRFDNLVSPHVLLWSPFLGNELSIGSKVTGFSFQSARVPGPSKYFVSGDSEVPISTATADDDEPAPVCPGFNFDETVPVMETKVVGVTTGPMSPGQVAAYIRIHRAEFAGENKAPYLEEKDPGVVHVTLLGSEKFDIGKVDTSTIAFGPGAAKPITVKTINTENKMSGEKGKDKHKSLLLKFAARDLGIRCNLDHALFITGKIAGSSFFGGAEISPEKCKVPPAKEHRKDADHKKEKKHDSH